MDPVGMVQDILVLDGGEYDGRGQDGEVPMDGSLQVEEGVQLVGDG